MISLDDDALNTMVGIRYKLRDAWILEAYCETRLDGYRNCIIVILAYTACNI